MPNVTMPNGFVVRDVPAGTTKAQLLSKLRSNGYNVEEMLVPPQEKSAIEGIPLVGGILGQLADYPATFVEGLAGVSKTAADAFGASNTVSDAIQSVADTAHGLRSAESRSSEMARSLRSREAEGKGTWEEIKAAGKNFLEAPLETTASLAGSAVPFIVAGATTDGVAVPLLMGAVSGAGTIKGDIYDAVHDELTKQGATEEQAAAAADKAQEYGNDNIDQIALGTALGAIASATGFSRQIAGTIGKRAAARVAERAAEHEAARVAAKTAGAEAVEIGSRKSMLGGAVKGALEEAVPEALQAGQERLAQNVALQREGVDVDTWKGVAGQAAFEGIASLFLGGVGGVREARMENQHQFVKELKQEFDALPPDADDETKSAAVERFIQRGIPDDVAQTIVERIASQKAAIEERAAALKQQQEEAIAARNEGVEPSAEPDIGAPPPVDAEEEAARYAAYSGGEDMLPSMDEIGPTAQFNEEMAAPTPTAPQPTGLTPERAGMILNDPVALSDYEASGGDINDLYAVAEGANLDLKYSRGRRPKDTSTTDMFGALPLQEAPGESAKREEFNAQRFAPAEQKAAMQEQAMQQVEAGQERAAALQQREAADREEKRGDIEYALRAQAPENAVYRVDYNPDDASPYKLVAETQLGKKPEEVFKAKTLQELSDYVYGNMDELTPYTPATPAGIEELEKVAPTEQEAPTVATRMMQDFTAEVDAAHEAGQIDNNQRSQLLNRLHRPNAYRMLPNGRQVANDAIADLEEKALAAASAERNASADEKEAATAARKEANQRLRAAVKNSLLNPARAALKSMVEMRQDERLGARIRTEEAKTELGRAQVQKKLGEMEDRDIAPLRRDLSAEQERVTAAKKEARDASIDLKESKVQKYRRAQAAATGMAVNDVQSIVDSVLDKSGITTPIKVVRSVKDIADPTLRAAITRDKATDAEGFVAPDGTVYMIADNLGSAERVKAVLFHETLGHLGLEKLFRESLDTALVAMYRGNPKLKADTDKWRQENKGAYERDANPLARAVEEVLAERSEAGKLDRSLFQRLATLVRNFARRMGFRLAISDGDVAAILAMAHEQAIAPVQTRQREDVKYATKTSTKTADELRDAEASMSDGLRRTLNTQNTYAMADGLTEAIKARKLKPFLKGLKENYNGFKPAALKATLASLPTSGIIDWFGTEIPSLKDIDELVLRMGNMKANILKAAEDTALRLDQFLLLDKDKQLATVQSVARINEVSPDEFKSMVDALQNDKVMQEVEKRILANANDKTAAKQLIQQIKDLVVAKKDATMSNGKRVPSVALRTLLTQLERTAIDRTKSEEHVEQIAEMSRRIRDTYAEWDKLSKVPGGQRLYKEMRAFYKDMFEAELALRDSRIESITDKDPADARNSDDIFKNIDANLFTKDYFPFMREDKYWLRVKGDKNGTREKEFYTFYSAKERDRALAKAAKRLGADASNPEVFSIGDDIADLQADLKSEDLMMQRVFDLVAKAKSEISTKGAMDKLDANDLFDNIYQTWLLSTPERSVRRRLMHAEETTGFSQDILNHFSRQATAYANQLSKMAFAGQIRMQVKTAQENIADRPVNDRRKLESVINEMSARAEQEINPDPQSAIVNVLNRASYFYYLTSPATAVVQTTSIPIRVVPRLWKDYGYAKGTAMWVKYMKVWNTLGLARTEKTKTGLGDQLHGIMPSITGSKLINNNTPRGKLLQRALKAGMDRNVLETVTDTLLQNERETTKKHREGVARSATQLAAETGKVMGVLFQGMENISRQAAYFMTFELAYDDYKAKNPNADEQEVFDHAVAQGLDVVRNTLGEYSNWERPRIAKNNWTRALFLFKMYSVVQTKFLVQSFRAMTKGLFSDWGADAKAARAGAFREFSGVMMMAGMFGGLMGLPLYSLMAMALAEGFDDEDDDDVRKLMGLDPRVAYDSDIMFRKWLMEKFGTPKVGDMDLAEILINGPIGALTDTEISSRTSLDLKNMWFREGMGGDSTDKQLINMVTANVAGAQMAVNLARGYDDFAKGDIYGGLKKFAPAFFRSWVTAAQGETEGIKDSKGNTIIPKEDISAMDTARSLLGFRPMSLARWQDYYITRAKNEKRIEGEKTAILEDLNQRIQDGDIKTGEDFQKFLKDEVIPFNRTYPDPTLAITMDTIDKSLKGKEKVRERTVAGMQLQKKTAQRDYGMAREFMPK